MFSPQSLRAFRVSVDGQELRSWRQDVPAAAQAGFGADWLMWEMTYPAGQAVRVEVSYEQVLTDRPGQPVVQPMYVLRTGALWAGPIGDAVVTFSAPDGGAFVGGPELFSRSEADGSTTGYPRADQLYGPYGVAGSSPTRIAWRFHDFEPKGDVGATYVRSGPWKRYLDADGVLLFHVRPSAPELQEAAASALAILTGSLHCGRPAGAACIEGPFGVSRSLVGHLADGMRVNIRRAVELAPDDAMTQLTYGDVEFWWAMPWRKHHGELGCWPTRAADAYERAVELGASDAAARLDDLRVAARQTRVYPDGRLFTCSRQGDTRLDVELIKATIEHGNSAWAAGVGRGGSADWYRAYFAGDWLAERQAEVADLRASGRYRDAHPTGIEIGDVTLNGDGTATADATEQWDDKTYASDRSLVRDASGTLRQRYQLQYLDDQWKIVGATIIRP